MFDGISASTIAYHILTCPFGEWENYARLLNWVRRVHTAKSKQIVDAMEWDAFDSVIGNKWRSPPRELRLLLSALRKSRDGEPINAWIAMHAERIESIDPLLAGISPNAAVMIVRNGGQVELGGHNGSDWSLQAWALARSASYDEQAARGVLQHNRAHLAKGIATLPFSKGMPKLLDVAHGLDRELVTEIIMSLTVDDVRERWTKALKDQRKPERAAAREVLRRILIFGGGPVKDLSKQLLQRVRHRTFKGSDASATTE